MVKFNHIEHSDQILNQSISEIFVVRPEIIKIFDEKLFGPETWVTVKV